VSARPRFPEPVDAALRAAGWRPGRLDMRRAENWADALRAHVSPAGHRHTVFPAAVEVWAEFGGLTVRPGPGRGREVAPTAVCVDPLRGLHLARTLGDLSRALDTALCPVGEEDGGPGLLAVDAEGRVYALDHTGDWYLGAGFDAALTALLTGVRPHRLTR
jgi:hypothetical protein